MPNHLVPPIKPDAKGQHWINFMHLGRKYYNLILWAPSPMMHKKWLELIVKQQQMMRDHSMIFDTVTLSDGFFFGPNKVNCAAPFSKIMFPFCAVFVVYVDICNRWRKKSGLRHK